MKEIFDEILATIENDDIRKFAEMCIESAPEYWHSAPASSSGKYHPSYSLGEGGLVRHSIAVVRFLNHMFDVESISNQFTPRERDLLRVAAITHDMQKSGTQGDFEKSKWTKFDHPLRIAKIIRDFKGLVSLPDDEIELIAHAIESHMGEWNTDKRYPDITLPKPKDKYQIILHLADYLASRKDIEIKFNNILESSVEPPKVDTYKLDFGKHAGKTIPEIHKEDRGWLHWAKNNVTREPFATLIKEFKPKETTNE